MCWRLRGRRVAAAAVITVIAAVAPRRAAHDAKERHDAIGLRIVTASIRLLFLFVDQTVNLLLRGITWNGSPSELPPIYTVLYR
jgi:hypothetical protein